MGKMTKGKLEQKVKQRQVKQKENGKIKDDEKRLS